MTERYPVSKWASAWNRVLYGWDLNLINTDLDFMLDVSHWIVKPDLFNEEKFVRKMQQLDLKGIIFKVSDSDGSGKMFTDATADFWYKLARKHNLLTAGYHWLQPNVDPTVAWKYYQAFMADHPGVLPSIVDFEEPSVTKATDYLWRLETFLKCAGPDAIIYTAMGYVLKMKNLLPREDWNKKLYWISSYTLWLARYSRFWPKDLWPWDDDAWKIWQYSAAADFPYYVDNDGLDGTEWGFQAKGLDMNWAKKSYLQPYIDRLTPAVPEPQPQPEPEPQPQPLPLTELDYLRDILARVKRIEDNVERMALGE